MFFPYTGWTPLPHKHRIYCWSGCVDSWVRRIESDLQTLHMSVFKRAHIKVQVLISINHTVMVEEAELMGWTLQISSVTGENNIFEHLRHSILLQAGANACVLQHAIIPLTLIGQKAFNNNSSGSLVLHGNYTLQFIWGQYCTKYCRRCSHGLNGPFNTFRNRSENYGILCLSAADPTQHYRKWDYRSSGIVALPEMIIFNRE